MNGEPRPGESARPPLQKTLQQVRDRMSDNARRVRQRMVGMKSPGGRPAVGLT